MNILSFPEVYAIGKHVHTSHILNRIQLPPLWIYRLVNKLFTLLRAVVTLAITCRLASAMPKFDMAAIGAVFYYDHVHLLTSSLFDSCVITAVSMSWLLSSKITTTMTTIASDFPLAFFAPVLTGLSKGYVFATTAMW